MKSKKVLVLSLMVIMSLFFFASQIIHRFRVETLRYFHKAETGDLAIDDSAKEFYKDQIDKYASRYFLKAALFRKLRFDKLRANADLALKKAVFFKTNKKQLVRKMITQKVGRKNYHIDIYLNKEFHESGFANECVADLTPATSE